MTVVGASGGAVASSDGNLAVAIPAGALANNVTITTEPVETPPAGAVGTVYEIGPSGTQFAMPVTLTLQYDPAELGGTPPSALRVATYANGSWQLLPGAVVDTQAKTVSGVTTHLSPYAIVAESAGKTCATVQANFGCPGTGPAGGSASQCTAPTCASAAGVCGANYPGSAMDGCVDGPNGYAATCCFPAAAPICFPAAASRCPQSSGGSACERPTCAGATDACGQYPGASLTNCTEDQYGYTGACCFAPEAPVCISTTVARGCAGASGGGASSCAPPPRCATGNPCGGYAGATVQGCTDTTDGFQATCCFAVGTVPVRTTGSGGAPSTTGSGGASGSGGVDPTGAAGTTGGGAGGAAGATGGTAGGSPGTGGGAGGTGGTGGTGGGGDQVCAPGAVCQPGARCGEGSPTSCMECVCGDDGHLKCMPCGGAGGSGAGAGTGTGGGAGATGGTSGTGGGGAGAVSGTGGGGGGGGDDKICAPGAPCQPGTRCGEGSPTSCTDCLCGADGFLDCMPCGSGTGSGGSAGGTGGTGGTGAGGAGAVSGSGGGDQVCAPDAPCQPGTRCGMASPTSCTDCVCAPDGFLDCKPCGGGTGSGGTGGTTGGGATGPCEVIPMRSVEPGAPCGVSELCPDGSDYHVRCDGATGACTCYTKGTPTGATPTLSCSTFDPIGALVACGFPAGHI